MGISQWSTSPASNATVGNINWAEGQAPSTVNNSSRQEMTDVADWYRNSAEFIDRDDSATFVSGTSIKFTGTNLTSIYSVGRRLFLTAATPGTLFGRITASSFSTDTTVTMVFDSTAVLSSEAISDIAVGIVKGSSTEQSLDISGVARMTNVSTFSLATFESTDAAAWRTGLGVTGGVITTRGDIVIGSTAGAAIRLAVGSSSQFITTDGADVSWATLPAGSTASSTASGTVELATAAEVKTGTDTGKVSPVVNMKSHEGVVKAWVNFNGTGTPAIRDSHNVTSITDNGTGNYTVNLSITMGSANFAVVDGGRRSAAQILDGGIQSFPASSTSVTVVCSDAATTATDWDIVSIMVIGDL